MDAAYVAGYRDLYLRHWWWRAREEVVASTLARLAAGREGGFGPILDVGCGDGLLFPVLRRFGEPEGIEPEAGAVTEEGRSGGTIHVAPFDAAVRPGRRYGLVLFLDVLEHLPDDAGALALARDLLAPGGVVLVTVPAFRLLWTAHDDLNRHQRRYTRASLRRAAAAAGLLPVADRYFFHWVFAAKLAVRAAERLRGARPEVPGVPAEPWNRLLVAASRAEERLLRPLRLPFGGSVLAVLAPRAAAGDGAVVR
jgi:SAM-dependent methyltransferase